MKSGLYRMYGKNLSHYQDVTVRLKSTLSSESVQKMIQQYDDNII